MPDQQQLLSPTSPTDGWPPSPNFTLSSNPPNPKTSFRAGDWICAEAHCSAHNFGRNSTCIGCGRQRHPTATPGASEHLRIVPPPPFLAPPMARLSPRFAVSASASTGFSTPGLPTDFARAAPGLSAASRTQSSPGALAQPPSPIGLGGVSGAGVGQAAMGPRASHPYPLLTPSGRAISVGGRVQNVSSDPLAPCIMYWPDNEPLPEQGQIRPSGSAVITYPPIINTGNKGAAEKQPGDWVCQKCNYLNWRRRKVCQTCFPYAEGNGDSISAAVQAERIALLENVLATQVEQTHLRKPAPATLQLARQSSLPHLSAHSPASASFADLQQQQQQQQQHPRFSPISPLSPASPWSERAPARGAPAEEYAPPIYQTSEARGAARGGSLLPGFLADIVHSDAPSLSPSTSTSSAELSLDTDEYDELRRAAHFTYGAAPGPHAHANGAGTANANGYAPRRAGGGAGTNPLTIHEHSIWKLDGAELSFGTRGAVQGRPTKPTTIPRDLAHGLVNGHGGGGGAGVQGLAAAVAALTIAPGPAGRR